MPEQTDVLETAVLERGPECADCEVVFSKVGVIGSDADSILLDRTSEVVLLDDGRFVVAPTAVRGQAAVFDSAGARSRPFGRPGEGPGESVFLIGAYPWAGDSVLMFGSFRFNFLGGERGTGRTTTYTKGVVGASAIGLPAEGLVVVNNIYLGTGQFVVFDALGAVRREMGLPRLTGETYSRDAVLGRATRAHSFWAGASRYRHHLELWDVDGTLVKELDKSPVWFTPFDSASLRESIRSGDLAARPMPFLKSLRETTGGKLWVIYEIPAKAWVAEVPGATADKSHEGAAKPYHRQSRDGMIELLDARSGELVVAEWMNLPITGFVNDTLVYDRREREDGVWELVIYQVRIRRFR